MDNILVYSPEAIHKCAFDLVLELAETRLEAGCGVTLLYCNAGLSSCYSNPHHKRSVCILCRSTFNSGYAKLEQQRRHLRSENLLLLTSAQEARLCELRDNPPRNLRELRDFKIDDADLGMAAHSSLIDATLDSEPDFEKNRELILATLTTAAIVYYSFCNRFERERPDEFLLFNGRIVSTRPALRAAQRYGINFKVFEYFERSDRYILIDRAYPHSLTALKQYLLSTYETSPLPADEKWRIARTWFENRRNKNVPDWMNYTKDQKSGVLPASFDRNLFNVAIFVSSEDEFAAIEEWRNPHYLDQAEGLTRLFTDFRSSNKIQFIVRVHPRLARLENAQTRFFRSLKQRFPEIEVIYPDNPVSSYELLDHCNLVLTYGSTMGVEALYARKPSVLMGRAIYEDWGGIIRPESHEELTHVITTFLDGQRSVDMAGYELAMARYGFALLNAGLPLKYILPVETSDGVVPAFHRDGHIEVVRPGAFAVARVSPSSFLKQRIMKPLLEPWLPSIRRLRSTRTYR